MRATVDVYIEHSIKHLSLMFWYVRTVRPSPFVQVLETLRLNSVYIPGW